MSRSLFLLADRLPPAFGGMEAHAVHFQRRFDRDASFPLRGVVTKDSEGCDVLLKRGHPDGVPVGDVGHLCASLLAEATGDSAPVLFFNSGRWIEQLDAIRHSLPGALLCQRTGGNEILQARLAADTLSHDQRRAVWVSAINRNVRHLISNSRYTDGRLEAIGVDAGRIVMVSGGVESAACALAVASRDGLRRRHFGGLSGRPVVVVACRLVPFKGVDLAIRAVAYGRQERDLAFVCVGDGPLRDELEGLARQLLGPENILFLGARDVDTSLEVVAAADVYCSLSREWLREVGGGTYIHTETMGRSVLEAICAGVPVVASRVGALPEFVDRECGTLVPPEDADAAGRAILAELQRPATPATALDRRRAQHGWDRVFASYVELWKAS